MADPPGDGAGDPIPAPPSGRAPQGQPIPPEYDERTDGPSPAYPPPPPPPFPPPAPYPPYSQPGPPYQQPGPPFPGTPTLASFGFRLAAWLIDWIITSAVSAVVLIPVHAVHQVTTVAGSTSFTVSTQGIALTALLVIIYGTVCIGSRRGQTLGMMVLRLRALDATSGGSVTYARALGRALVEYAFLVLLFIPWVVDMLFPLWDPRRQTLHDKALNTVVIRF